MNKFLLLLWLLLTCLIQAEESKKTSVNFTYQDVTGIGYEKGICRRDPSDVIKVGDKHYVWYTKLHSKLENGQRTPIYPEGYYGTIWYATSTDNGYTWKEEGMAIDKGKDGELDSFGILTPNIIKEGSKYFLYYTAVQNGFDNKPDTRRNETTIVMAESDSPDGPWIKKPSPMISPGRGFAKFDSFRVDDACLVKHEGKFLLYFKGRQWRFTPRDTKMGVAIADTPRGPFRKLNNGDFIQDSGHECLIWNFDGKIYSLASNTGPNPNSLWQSQNGLKLDLITKGLKKLPHAPGLYRPELTGLAIPKTHKKWGIAMKGYGGDPCLIRYEMEVKEK